MKIFISMPMNGKSREEIITRREEITNLLIKRFPGQKIDVIDSVIDSDKGPVWCLGRSIQLMKDAELVVFDKNWRNARGCKIENNVCAYYGYRFLEL